MKKLASIFLIMMMSVAVVSCGSPGNTSNSGGSEEVKELVCDAVVETWEAPEEYGRNTTYKVEVSEDGKEWEELAVYNVKNGHQLNDPLLRQSGSVYFGTPYEASLVTFDFTGTVGVRVTYNAGTLKENGYVISPDSYQIEGQQAGNTVTFTMTQNADSPRKVVFRPEGEWEAKTLHIMTNVPESSYKVDATKSNVYVIEEGQEIPRVLPEGKDTYYFKKGMHTLPGGYWVDLDLGEVKAVESFDLLTPTLQSWTMPGGLCYEIQAKASAGDTFETVYKSVGEEAENNFNMTAVPLQVSAQYFRLILHGNFTYTPMGDYRSIHAAQVKEFTLYDGAGNNLSLNKAYDGSAADYALVTDGQAGGDYGYAYAGETFAAQSGYTYYLEKGTVVKGAFIAENRENITISGRGILDGCELVSTHELSEGRNGSIHFEYCKNVRIDGITIMNAPMWMVVVNYSQDVQISGINLFGYCTNADGIHFSATKNAVATGCFIRSTDDLFVAYHYGDADNLVFKNSVLWSDGARVLLLGLANTGNIRNVTMENCDVITYQNVWNLQDYGGFAQIVASGGRTISNVRIKDVRIDEVRSAKIAQFLQIRAGIDLYGTGFVENITVENVSYASECKVKSMIAIAVPNGSVENVTLKNVSVANDVLNADNISNYVQVDSGIEIKFN